MTKLTPTTRLLLLYLVDTRKTYVELLAYLDCAPAYLTHLLKSLIAAKKIARDTEGSYFLTPTPSAD